jgi:hypothetical protein
MIGYNESQILTRINEGALASYPKRKIATVQPELLKYIEFTKQQVFKGVARAIVANNKRVEEDLRKAGLTIKNEGLPSD